MRIIDYNAMLDLPQPGIDWLVEDLIPKPGVTILLGQPKSGKTFLATDLAFRIARGEPFMARKTKPGRVLYLQLDTSPRVLRERGVHLRASGYNTVAPNLVVTHPDDTMRPLNVMFIQGEQFLKDAIKRADPDLVIIDTLREIHQDDENDSTAMKIVMDKLEHACLGRSLLLIHHTKKIDANAPNPSAVTASRGSSYITGRVDSFWLLANGRLEITTRWSDPINCMVRQTRNGMFIFPTLSPPAIPPATHVVTAKN